MVERGIVLVLFHLHYTIAMISQISDCPWSTIKNVLDQTAVRGYIESAPRSGRPNEA